MVALVATVVLLIASGCSDIIITEEPASSRYGTAAALATEAFPDGTDTALLATGRSFADALAAAPLAARRNAPILLTEPAAVPDETLDALEDLDVSEVILLGGPGAISEEAQTQLSESYEVSRQAGADRFETAGLLAQRAFPDGADVALLADGGSFADALAAAPLSSASDAPILLTTTGEVPDATLAALGDLGVERVVLLGGTAAIGEDVEAQLAFYGLEVSRTAGASRFETAALLTRPAMPDGADTAILVTGQDFPDALAAAPLAHSLDAPILLTATDSVPAPTRAALEELGVTDVVLVGGTAAISEAVEDRFSEDYEVSRHPE